MSAVHKNNIAMLHNVLSILVFVTGSCASAHDQSPIGLLSPWDSSRFKSFITFGDSYTDESRLGYFIDHNGTAPPPGTLMPENPDQRSWARYVVRYAEQSMNLYNYAVSGAVCSNNITPRPFPAIHADFPSVMEYEIPAFLADGIARRTGTSQSFFDPELTASNAVYAIFIGTNDLGNIAYLTDSQLPGRTIRDYTSCVYSAFDRLHAAGGRNFILINTAPLHLLPQYSVGTHHDTDVTRFYPDKDSNKTRISTKMLQQTTSVNEIFKYQTPYEVLISSRYPGANFAVFDTWKLYHDIYTNPKMYLNGSEPVTVEDWEIHCDMNFENCFKRFDGTSPDSFMWADELHPSEQVHRIMAKEILNTMNGRSEYATYW